MPFTSLLKPLSWMLTLCLLLLWCHSIECSPYAFYSIDVTHLSANLIFHFTWVLCWLLSFFLFFSKVHIVECYFPTFTGSPCFKKNVPLCAAAVHTYGVAGTLWMNWVMVGASAVGIPLLFLMKEQYNRLDLDEHNPSLNAEYVVEPPLPQY